MKERPIIMGAESVRAILAGTKTQTRRVVRNVPDDAHTFSRCEADGSWIIWCSRKPDGSQAAYDRFTQRAYPAGGGIRCPYGAPGDRLWVRETWYDDAVVNGEESRGDIYYRADGEAAQQFESPERLRWSSPIHMPRWASRLLLEVTAVRVERLQDISQEDARAEGVQFDGTYWLGGIHPVKGTLQCWPDARKAFSRGWDSINGKRAPWASNPWVWVITFRPGSGER